jgi:hypothetical protein
MRGVRLCVCARVSVCVWVAEWVGEGASVSVRARVVVDRCVCALSFHCCQTNPIPPTTTTHPITVCIAIFRRQYTKMISHHEIVPCRFMVSEWELDEIVSLYATGGVALVVVLVLVVLFQVRPSVRACMRACVRTSCMSE